MSIVNGHNTYARAQDPGRFAARVLAIGSSLLLTIDLILIFLHIPAYAYALDKSILPKFFYLFFLVLLLPLVMVRLRTFFDYLCTPFAIWAGVLLLLNVIHMLSNGDLANARGDAIVTFRMQAIGLAVLLGFACENIRSSKWQRSFVVLAVLLPWMIVMDFLSPGMFYPLDTLGTVSGRAAGTLINPTIAGEAIMLAFILALPLVKNFYRTPLILLAGIGVLLTFTRAAILCWLIVWIFLIIRRRVPVISALAGLALIVLPLLMGGVHSYISHRNDFSSAVENIQDRLLFFTQPKMEDDSARQRSEVLHDGINLFLKNPLTGAGAGVTEGGQLRVWAHPVSTHNQLAALAAEYGIVGIAMWVWLLILLVRGRYFQDRTLQTAAVLLFLWMTFFTHNMLDFPYWLLAFSLLSSRKGMPVPHKTALPAPAPAFRNMRFHLS